MKKIFFIIIMLLVCESKSQVIDEISFKIDAGMDWYKVEKQNGGVKHIHIPGTHWGDIRGYPVDKKPDIGAYEYSSPTCNEDLQRRIFPYIDNIDPNQNWPGDMNWDGLVNYDDYWILGSWWVNYDESLDPNTILLYPSNTPSVMAMLQDFTSMWLHSYDPNDIALWDLNMDGIVNFVDFALIDMY